MRGATSATSAVRRIVVSTLGEGVKARRDLADRLRRTLDVLERGRLRVAGEGHSREATIARLKARIEELERG